tara:strand:- start:583 stop:1941 length:1359 start_codon:yes stop_codon:yes gene_type:complete
MSSAALRHPLGLRLASIGFLAFWCVLALFPLFWIVVMSFKLPLDAFAEDSLQIIFGSVTRAERGGLSLADIVAGGALLWLLYRVPGLVGRQVAFQLGTARWGRVILVVLYALGITLMLSARGVTGFTVLGALAGAALVWLLAFSGEPEEDSGALGNVLAAALYLVLAAAFLWYVVPTVLHALDQVLSAIPVLDLLATPLIGVTAEHYRSVWIDKEFYRNFLNTMLVTGGVTTVSLTVGTLAGYGLARSSSNIAFWLLILALVFRALPHSVLVTGYLPPFINSREILQPLWDMPVIGWFLGLFSGTAPTLYGQPYAVIAVLVSINQPFTIWMLRSFFQSIPTELDEAARVDGCSDFQAFRKVIMPVMWPGVITTGLFSFLLAYNDYLICSLLLNSQNQTMVPSITQFFNSETTTTDQVQAIAAAVSITAPLFLLVMVFQKQIVSGLTAGAVKG